MRLRQRGDADREENAEQDHLSTTTCWRIGEDLNVIEGVAIDFFVSAHGLLDLGARGFVLGKPWEFGAGLGGVNNVTRTMLERNRWID